MKFIKNKDDYANIMKVRAKALTAVNEWKTFAVTSYPNFIENQQISMLEPKLYIK